MNAKLTTLMSETLETSSSVIVDRMRRRPAERRISHLIHYNDNKNNSYQYQYHLTSNHAS